MADSNSENKKPKKQLRNVAILSGVAIQMGVTIYLFVLLGKWLDTKYNNGDKLFIIIMTLAGVGISLYAVIKQLNRINND
ncbi:AtpZ/AtpI family protein [Seonamhaeicola maritimus]|uniref:AtpZ/AtpI family protein n=1 Tax=Seonamhaeicola maritimus TaxID=2591822 RepID=A0A5C7GHL6_9FLAO|nr:AtpZ/AtpI family protein [Seonamhaeicola maritimus]TXG37126.1 AtpZ/AtpI family protein [Seonamhaeicola maritimus]